MKREIFTTTATTPARSRSEQKKERRKSRRMLAEIQNRRIETAALSGKGDERRSEDPISSESSMSKQDLTDSSEVAVDQEEPLEPDGAAEVYALKYASEIASGGRCLFTRDDPTTFPEAFTRYYYYRMADMVDDKFGHVCEQGSGRGSVSMYIENSRTADSITLVDLSEAGLDLAKANFEAEDLNIPALIVADVRKTGYSSDVFDVVFSIGLLEHFADPVPVMEEAFRILASGGLFYHIVVENEGDGVKRFDRGAEYYAEKLREIGFVEVETEAVLHHGITELRARKVE